jgi:hypothetical protein
MKQNVGSLDRFIRLLVGTVILVLLYNDFVNGSLAVVLVMLAVVLIGTAVLGVCPVYRLFHIHTASKELL